ncbi:hypothetical protein CMQ_8055 [Grosmannia clavigera kw1407]|uniref:Uncharacterized protein n=1 Tax=Grosmannia clavigera (strain kw1407 / UAMH 11150) TaxID=655863 RepID=F0XKW4_GROCL|nr:uncharacterized protein CMQ_8055 [Grosmannia clavigera kw1407]EFX01589.1 hypothetical protein CMQ_8055 [Grosmannia clavigera kw1407]
MVVVEKDDFDDAIRSLLQNGFRDAPWSYRSTADPRLFEDEFMQNLHREVALEYSSIDKNSARFLFPTESNIAERAVLVPSSYAHISLTDTPKSRFTCVDGIYYPDGKLLLESFAKTCMREPEIDS